jgi:hypothetical protein
MLDEEKASTAAQVQESITRSLGVYPFYVERPQVAKPINPCEIVWTNFLVGTAIPSPVPIRRNRVNPIFYNKCTLFTFVVFWRMIERQGDMLCVFPSK